MPIAGKKPELIVPPPVCRAARALLGEIQALLGRREMTETRELLVKRIEESRRHAYSVGYRDATEGKPEDDNRFNH